MSKRKPTYKVKELPVDEDLRKFAIPYTSEHFTREEKKFLIPFFSNLDQPLFVLKNLPEEVAGALSSRYSRATRTMRRMFLDEYIAPILHPEKTKAWTMMGKREKQDAKMTRKALLDYIVFFHKKGGIDKVVNIQRGRKFFDKWLADYGDDSIAEMGGVHVCIEGLSNIAVKEIEDKRIGVSPIEKSTRYVQFWDKRPDGEYQYITPAEIKGTALEKGYRETMDLLFRTYSDLAEPYFQYISKRYPKGTDETDMSFTRSRSAKRFDDIRDILPIGTQTYVALFGNGRAFEDLVGRLLSHELGEVRYWGQLMCRELSRVVPSFVTRSQTERGAELQYYRKNVELVRREVAKREFSMIKGKKTYKRWVSLLNHTPASDVQVLSTYLFSGVEGVSLFEIMKAVKKMSKSKRNALIKEIIDERKFGRKQAERFRDRFKKVPRAFESAHFLYELWARAGDYRDLQRHRQLSQARQSFTVAWGYDLETEVLEFELLDKITGAYKKAETMYEKLCKKSPVLAQYVVPLGYIQHWYMDLTAREIYWMAELRTGPQGREHYRQICQDMVRKAIKAEPALFQGVLVDNGSYALSRRESEKKIEKKKKALGL